MTHTVSELRACGSVVCVTDGSVVKKQSSRHLPEGSRVTTTVEIYGRTVKIWLKTVKALWCYSAGSRPVTVGKLTVMTLSSVHGLDTLHIGETGLLL